MMKKNKVFRIGSKLREEIEIRLPDGRIIEGPRGSAVAEFLSPIGDWDGSTIIAAIVDGNLRELTHILVKDADVAPLNMSTSDGSKIYRRSLTFLLDTAFEEIFEGYSLSIDHSVPNGGYFCKVIGRQPLSITEIRALEDRMNTLVSLNLPIEKERVDLDEAVAFFEDKKHKDKVRLLKYRKKPYLMLYRLGRHRDYHHGYMVPDTGLLKVFRLIPRGEGFILQYPRRSSPGQLLEMPAYDKLLAIFEQYGSWLESLDIDSVGALNDSIASGSIREVILVSEALHEQKISDIAAKIANHSKGIKIVLIAGPTSSGKTTFSKRLAVQLLTRGISPFPLEMDNYFVNRDQTPKDEFGNFNFEAYEALDSAAMERDLQLLLNGETVQLPKFNFQSGFREPGKTVKLGKNQIILIEGIHGLNPKLLDEIDKDKKFRIYASCLTQLNLDHYNRISTTDTRMLRRIVRDAHTRGFSAQRTIELWESIRRGEREYIFPNQENADEIFNSALVYELAALKNYAEPLLRQIPFGTEAHLEAKRLLTFLEWFLPIDREMIPDNSILREFIGASILADFNLWHD
jgi:uridine kinase